MNFLLNPPSPPPPLLPHQEKGEDDKEEQESTNYKAKTPSNPSPPPIFFFCIPSNISGVNHFGWDFCVCDRFSSNHRGSHIPSLWMVHAGCDFVASIHPSRKWMSGSLESVRGNACVHRLDLSLYLIRKRYGGMESETMLTPREKIASTGGSEEFNTHDTASHRTLNPTHY